ncbi:MAG: hypothetical protein ACJAYI_001432 [Myxococcota bacterium]
MVAGEKIVWLTLRFGSPVLVLACLCVDAGTDPLKLQ